MRIPPIIKLLRIHQWLKNAFIFMTLFFSRHMMDWEYIVPCVIAFVAYSFSASAIYCFNDIWDVEADKAHPVKRERPIACGAVSKRAGCSIAVACVIVSLCVASIADRWQNLWCILVFYLLLNVAYCVKLKHIAIVDVLVIALGFVLRLIAGGVASSIEISHWIVLVSFLLALFLALAKRRDDVVIFENTGVEVRRNVNRYNLAFINQAIGIVASITIVCYIMYTVSEEVIARVGSQYLYTTSFFVIAGIIRYLQLTIVDVRSGSPTKVLMKDVFIQLCIVGWLIVFAGLLYL